LEAHDPKTTTQRKPRTSSWVHPGPAVRNVVHIRDPTELELQEADSSADSGGVVFEFPADPSRVPGAAYAEAYDKALEELIRRSTISQLVYGNAKILVDQRDPTKVVFHDVTYPKERVMEKNGNTFAPGDTVVAGINPDGKTASARRSGTIQEACNDDQVKVAWDDGTTTLERPEHLQRG
jgi:hypothetical protein